MTNRTKCNQLSLEDAAWIGGFFDGEGHAIYAAGHLKVCISQKEREVLDWIQKVTGVGHISPDNKWKGFRWQANGIEAVTFLEEIEFHVKTKNHKDQIEHAFSEMERDGRL